MMDSFEKIPVKIFPSVIEGSKMVANEIAQLIREKAARNEKCVLGMATGNTPVKLYKELVRMHREEGLSFQNVITFNLDEYYPIEKTAYQSYWSFMHRNLFNHIDINPANIHIPDGSWPKDTIKKHCAEYEQKLADLGGVDLQLLGIGLNGHIGFNEPGSGQFSRTRLVNLDNTTRIANTYEFE
ncbi:MAG: glucosamine-6-phosphate deaminase, partial [Chitinophagia bacterium]|nr:glucosamine-6-phosphate deaminase [Chitinophagia bacterium]